MSPRIWQVVAEASLRRLKAAQKTLYGTDLELKKDVECPVKVEKKKGDK